MKKIFTLLSVLVSFSAFSQKDKTTQTKSADLNERPGLDKVQFHYMDLGRDQFNSIKGASTSRQISGVDRPFFFSSVDLDKNHKGYIGESEQYPEFEVVMSDLRFKDKHLESDFDTLVGLVKSCLDPNQWVIQMKDASNDIYLEGTDYKKLVCRENKSGMKMKFELFMYNNRVRGYWVVEFHTKQHQNNRILFTLSLR